MLSVHNTCRAYLIFYQSGTLLQSVDPHDTALSLKSIICTGVHSLSCMFQWDLKNVWGIESHKIVSLLPKSSLFYLFTPSKTPNYWQLLIPLLPLFVCVCVLVAQSYPTFCHHMDCSLPHSSVHGILQARILEWVAVPFSKGPSSPRDRTQVFCMQADSLPSEPTGKPFTVSVVLAFTRILHNWNQDVCTLFRLTSFT